MPDDDSLLSQGTVDFRNEGIRARWASAGYRTTPLARPLYPHRDLVKAGECGRRPLKDLERWVKGGTFHPYGVRAYDQGPTLEEALERMRAVPAILDFEGRLAFHGHVEFSVRFRQAGDADSWGLCCWHFTPEDAAYAALTLIEEHEREVYEQSLVAGLA